MEQVTEHKGELRQQALADAAGVARKKARFLPLRLEPRSATCCRSLRHRRREWACDRAIPERYECREKRRTCVGNHRARCDQRHVRAGQIASAAAPAVFAQSGKPAYRMSESQYREQARFLQMHGNGSTRRGSSSQRRRGAQSGRRVSADVDGRAQCEAWRARRVLRPAAAHRGAGRR